MTLNKSLATNLTALVVTITAYTMHHDVLFSVGIFALSGAVTNWLAIHMLFEKVPGLYGSGVVPAHFEDFKRGIRNLMMDQFFNDENIDRFLNSGQTSHMNQHLAPVIQKLDLTPAYDTLVKTIMESSFGGMLTMFGGQDALVPLKEPFIENMRMAIIDISATESFSNLLIDELEQPDVLNDIRGNIENIVDKRLDELTPQLVKTIIQDMIRQHLGWLVIWGGLFGGLIGLLSALLGVF
ncbi:MAG: uncharacterized membrane protein YheB (UPF0754 family) [Gammaproteobacteria bacterium]|jgi:uncharacterized membrane protein YheB (UPF0754 family)